MKDNERLDKVLIVIPARKGSSFKGKNIYPVNGRMMIDYTLDSADINYQKKVVVTTDDITVKAQALERGFEVHDRPKILANDTATLDEVMVRIQKDYPEFDYYVCLPPTSPLRNLNHVQDALLKIVVENGDSLISVQEERKSIWKLHTNATFGTPVVERLKNRQDVEPYYIANGAIFISRANILKDLKKRMGGRVCLYVMNEMDSVDVHGLDDIKLAEFYLNEKGKK